MNIFIAKTEIVICEDSTKALKLMKDKSFIKHIIVMNNVINEEVKERAKEIEVNIVSFKDAIEIGSLNYREPVVSY